MSETIAHDDPSIDEASKTPAIAPPPPFYVTKAEERRLRLEGERLVPSPIIVQPSSFDEYVRQLRVPRSVMELARKAANIRLSAWEVQAIRTQLNPSADEPKLLRKILEKKAADDSSHPPYIRVACTGEGAFDGEAEQHGYVRNAIEYPGDYGSPAVLEIWPAQHYSPMHSHGDTTGIVYCLTGQLDMMAYKDLKWDAKKLGIVTLTAGQCAWLAGKRYAVHKVHCPMDGNGWKRAGVLNNTADFAASFHVYLNQDEVSEDLFYSERPSRDHFEYIDEKNHKPATFTTYSDLSWRALRMVLARTDLDPVARLAGS